MDIGKAFGQMFKDPQWVKKMLFYALFCFLCIFLVGIPFVVGYTVLILNNYVNGKDGLPEWEGNWELILMTGLKYILILLVFMVIVVIISFFTSGIVGIVAGILTSIEELQLLGLAFSLLQSLISFVINSVSAIFIFMVQIRFAKNLGFSEVFDFEWYLEFFKKSWKNLIIVWLLTMVTGIIAAAGLLALCIGVFFTAFYAMVVNQSLLAEVAKAAGEGVSSMTPVQPMEAGPSVITPPQPVTGPTMVREDTEIVSE